MENTDDDDHGGLVLIPGDVLIQILVWLPVISLLRFKSVCKSWRALIESSFFIHLHAATLTTTTTTSSNNKFGTFILQTSSLCDPTETRIVMLTPSRRSNGGGSGGEVFEEEDLGVPPFCKADLARWKVVGSCNGLICSKLMKDISLWNPATRQFRILPKSSLTLEERGLIDVSDDVFGFGFDVKTKDYKVVQIRPMLRYRKLVKFRIQVYSLSTNSWRVLEEEEEEGEGGINYLVAKSGQRSFDMSTDGLYLNGGSFFFRGGYGIEDGKIRQHFIIAFDFTKEIFTPIKHFPDEVVSTSTLILTYFGTDKIALLLESYSSSREEQRKYFVNDIWVLNNKEHDHDQEKQEEEEKESYYWTKLQHSIQISTSYSGWILPKAISDDGEFALIETRGGDNGAPDWKLQLFNLITKEEKTVFDFPTGMGLLKADIYKPTLVSVIGGGGGGGNGNGNGNGSSSSC